MYNLPSHSKSTIIHLIVTCSGVSHVCILTVYYKSHSFSEENEIHYPKHRKLRKGQGMATSTCISCSMYLVFNTMRVSCVAAIETLVPLYLCVELIVVIFMMLFLTTYVRYSNALLGFRVHWQGDIWEVCLYLFKAAW